MRAASKACGLFFSYHWLEIFSTHTPSISKPNQTLATRNNNKHIIKSRPSLLPSPFDKERRYFPLYKRKRFITTRERHCFPMMERATWYDCLPPSYGFFLLL